MDRWCAQEVQSELHDCDTQVVETRRPDMEEIDRE